MIVVVVQAVSRGCRGITVAPAAGAVRRDRLVRAEDLQEVRQLLEFDQRLLNILNEENFIHTIKRNSLYAII